MFDFAVFTVIAALMGMGVGGGGLLVIWLTVLEDMPQLVAQGINLYYFIFASVASLPMHIGLRKLDFKTVALPASLGAVFSLLGCRLAMISSEMLVRRIFAVLLIVGGATVFIKGFVSRKKKSKK